MHNPKTCWFCKSLKLASADAIIQICKNLEKDGYLDSDWWSEADCTYLGGY